MLDKSLLHFICVDASRQPLISVFGTMRDFGENVCSLTKLSSFSVANLTFFQKILNKDSVIDIMYTNKRCGLLKFMST